jgi:hypothetical protein
MFEIIACTVEGELMMSLTRLGAFRVVWPYTIKMSLNTLNILNTHHECSSLLLRLVLWIPEDQYQVLVADFE